MFLKIFQKFCSWEIVKMDVRQKHHSKTKLFPKYLHKSRCLDWVLDNFLQKCIFHFSYLSSPSFHFTMISLYRNSRSRNDSPVIIDVRSCHRIAKVGAHLEDIRTKKSGCKHGTQHRSLVLLADSLSSNPLSSPVSVHNHQPAFIFSTWCHLISIFMCLKLL